MKRTANIVAGFAALTGVALAAVSFNPPPAGKSSKRDESAKPNKTVLAVDVLEQQLQRRFHDHNNMTFGMERVLRVGTRAHYTAVMDMVRSDFRLLRDDGKPAAFRNIGSRLEVEIEPGHWIDQRKVKETMHPENEAETQAIATLKEGEVAIYTFGRFDFKTAEPTRSHGPAYLRQSEPDAPPGTAIADLARRAWIAPEDVTETSLDGWDYRISKVKADDQSCLNCHRNGSDRLQPTSPPFKVNAPIGMFVIGTKSR